MGICNSSDNGWTNVHEACVNDNDTFLHELYNKGENIDSITNDSKYIIKKAENYFCNNFNGFQIINISAMSTPTMIAVICKSTKCLELLLGWNIDIEKKNSSGKKARNYCDSEMALVFDSIMNNKLNSTKKPPLIIAIRPPVISIENDVKAQEQIIITSSPLDLSPSKKLLKNQIIMEKDYECVSPSELSESEWCTI